MKMKIPKAVNVLGHQYKIKLVSGEDLGQNTAGATFFPQRMILIDKSLHKELLWLTFLHEIKHAFDYENGDTQILTNQTLEKSCDQFASFILSLQKQRVL